MNNNQTNLDFIKSFVDIKPEEGHKDVTVALTISHQIGAQAFAMMGTQKDKWAENDALTFKVRGSKKVNRVRVVLTPMDEYSVEFYKMGRAPSFRVKKWVVDHVYNDMLREVIEQETGLYLSLGTMRKNNRD